MPKANKRIRDTGDGPTPERAAKAGEIIKLDKAGRSYVHRLSVLEQLRNNGALDKDKDTSAILFVAGLAFGDLMWSDPAVTAIRAIDPTRVKVDVSGFNSYLDRILDRDVVRKRYCEAIRYLERETLRVLTLIIVHNMSTEDVAAEIYGRDKIGKVGKLGLHEVRSTLRFGLRQIATWLRIPGYLKS